MTAWEISQAILSFIGTMVGAVAFVLFAPALWDFYQCWKGRLRK